MAINKKRFAPGQEAEWKSIRNDLIKEGRLGGSMVGVAAGVSPFKSPVRLWAEMKGILPEPDISGKESIRTGKDLEAYVATRFEDVSGKSVHRENCIFTNDDFPHLFASIDRKVSGEDSGLECKTANAMNAKAYAKDEFPKTYYAQVCSYLAVTGLKRWYLAVLVLGVAFKVYLVTRDESDLDTPPSWCEGVFFVSDEELRACETAAASFIASLADEHPPMVGGDDDTSDALREIYPQSNGASVEFGEDVSLLLDERASIADEIAEKEVRVAEIENIIREKLGADESARSGEWKISYKTSKPASKTDWKAVAADLNPPEEIVKAHTETRDATRVLRITKATKKVSA